MEEKKDFSGYFWDKLWRFRIKVAERSLEVAEFMEKALLTPINYESEILLFFVDAPLSDYAKVKGKLTALLSAEFDCRVELVLR